MRYPRGRSNPGDNGFKQIVLGLARGTILRTDGRRAALAVKVTTSIGPKRSRGTIIRQKIGVTDWIPGAIYARIFSTTRPDDASPRNASSPASPGGRRNIRPVSLQLVSLPRAASKV